MTQLHEHERLAVRQPYSIVKAVHQLELTMTAGNTSLAIAHGKSLDASKTGLCYGGWRANNSTDYSQLKARAVLDNTNVTLTKNNSAANDVVHCFSAVEFYPWAVKAKKSVTFGFGGTGTSGSISCDPALGEYGAFLPFWNGHQTGATNQNIENSSPFLSGMYMSDAGGGLLNLNYAFDALATLTNNVNLQMDFLFLSGDPALKYQPLSPYLQSNYSSPLDLYLLAADTSRVHNPVNASLLRQALTWNMYGGIGNKDFQNALMAARMTADNEYTATSQQAAAGIRRARSYPIAWSPLVVRKIARGLDRIPGSTGSVNVSLTGFTDFTKMAVTNWGHNSDNPFSNLFSYATTKLIDKNTLELKRATFGTSYTDTAWEVIEFW